MRGAASATVLLLLVAAPALAGCGHHGGASPAELALEREDLIFVVQALRNVQPQTSAEVSAAKAAWPLIAGGLGRAATSGATLDPRIAVAIADAQRLELPQLFGEREAARLTGPASELVGLYRAFSGLASRGWQIVGSMIEQVRHGPPAAAAFARANIALYIDSVYDAHFSLAQIGKRLAPAFAKLGGPAAFAGSLTQGEVDAVVSAYSEAEDRLQPHVGVRLGS